MNRGFKQPPSDQEAIFHSGISANKFDQSKNFNIQAYILGKQRMNEIDVQKAMSISLSRHNRSQTGGPY